MKTTENDGESVEVRHQGNSIAYSVPDKLNDIYHKWIREGRPTTGRLQAANVNSPPVQPNYRAYQSSVAADQPPVKAYQPIMVRRSIKPSRIRFTLRNIPDYFGEGANYQRLGDAFRQLLYGEKNIESIGYKITVVIHEGHYWIMSGSRWLYIFRRLEECGRISTIHALVKPFDMEKVDRLHIQYILNCEIEHVILY